MNKETILKLFSDFLDKGFGELENTTPVIKQFEDEKMEAIEFLYPLEQDDAHGERMDREEIVKMVDSMNKANAEGRLASNINHAINTNGWSLMKAWVNEVDCIIGNTFIPEGFPLAKTKFHSVGLWEARKAGTLMGLSIGARGRREVVEIEDE